MATATSKGRTSWIPVIGLLVLAGMVSGAGPAWAQLDCPLPAGLTAPPDPSVTAQQVENGSASLKDFALAAKRYSSRPISGPSETSYDRCVQRQEGSPWRSGSTYLVKLLPDGRIILHAKQMSLSGRLLKPAIFGAILQVLGIDPADLADPVDARTAFVNAIQADAAHFDVPGIPGASGYAAAYRADYTGTPFILLAGFDLDPSHLVDEEIAHPQPVVAAGDVVDRASLKTFVTAAGNYVIERLQTGDVSAITKSKVAFRDPDGPWRHGSVYLAVLDPGTGIILFHGAFPDRFELRQAGITRDAATGELIADQLVAAANSSPEGGFWLYYFDNPADDAPGVEVPKVGYARLFTGSIPLPGGGARQFDFIVNSGFYLGSEGEIVQRILAALEEGQTSVLFGINTPEDGDVVSGDAVAVSVMGAPTDTVHFAYRLAGVPEEPFTYAGAATNRDAMAAFAWDTLDLPDDDYELAALYTEDDGYSVIYDSIEVSVDNVGGGGGGGCAAAPLLPGGPVDPTPMVLVGLALVYLALGRRRPMRQAAMG